MRNVLVFSTKSNTTTKVETSATTWGELSSYLTSKGLYNPSGMKAIVKEGGHTLELKEAAIPETDFVLILIPTKNESGALIDADKLEEYIGEKLSELKEDILEYIEDNSVSEEDASLAAEAAAIKAQLGL